MAIAKVMVGEFKFQVQRFLIGDRCIWEMVQTRFSLGAGINRDSVAAGLESGPDCAGTDAVQFDRDPRDPAQRLAVGTRADSEGPSSGCRRVSMFACRPAGSSPGRQASG